MNKVMTYAEYGVMNIIVSAVLGQVSFTFADYLPAGSANYLGMKYNFMAASMGHDFITGFTTSWFMNLAMSNGLVV
jgi:hypothetical protein